MSFVSCTTSHVGLCSFLESIEHDFIKALKIHTDNQIMTYLSWQSIRVMIQRLWVQTPLGQFLAKFILCSVTLDLSDNLTGMRIVKNPNAYSIHLFIDFTCVHIDKIKWFQKKYLPLETAQDKSRISSKKIFQYVAR